MCRSICAARGSAARRAGRAVGDAPPCASATVAFWNSAGLAAAPSSAAARGKLDWLDGLLTDQAPDVLYLFEVIGSMPAFRTLRRWLTRRGYDCRFLPGQSERQHDGVLCVRGAAQQAGSPGVSTE